jgi:hypothetical protein
MLFNTAGRIFAMDIPRVPESWVRGSIKGLPPFLQFIID